MILEVFRFAGNPVYTEDQNPNLNYRLSVFARLLFAMILISIVFGMGITALMQMEEFSIGENKVLEFLEGQSAVQSILLIGMLVPAIEELLFRAPFWLFRKRSYFRWVFWGLTLAFGLIHMGNYTGYESYWWLAPILVAPQLNAGLFLGFIRVRFGLLWAIGLHGAYNLLLLGPFLLMHVFGIHNL